MNKNLLVVFSGPSGVGKGTVVKTLLQKANYSLSVSCTTRAPRENETNGVDYFFITKEKFLKDIENHGFLEFNEHFGNFYGTPKKFVAEKLKTHDVILEIEVDGALKVKRAYPEALLVMILPPNEEELRVRLKKRGTESAEEIEKRVERYRYELSKEKFYDYTVINDELGECVENIEKIIKNEKEIRQ